MDYVCVELINGNTRTLEYATHSVSAAWFPIFCAWTAVLNTATPTVTETPYANQWGTAGTTTTRNLQYGNIASFFDRDPYYAQTGVGARYTEVDPFGAVLDTQNCFSLSGSITTGGASFPPPETTPGQGYTMFFLDNTTGLVRGPKQGTMCETITVPTTAPTCTAEAPQLTRYGTCIADTTADCTATAMAVGNTICQTGKKTSTEACTIINDMRTRYRNNTVPERMISPGNFKWFVEDLLQYRVQDPNGAWDMETFVARNRTIYSNSLSDPRDPADGTRATGIFPKCSAPTCFQDQFTGKMSGTTQNLHDLMFQVDKLLEVTRQYCP